MIKSHIAGFVIAGLLAVWALYVIMTRGKDEAYSTTFGRFIGQGMLWSRAPDDLPKKGVNPGIGSGAEGKPTNAVGV